MKRLICVLAFISAPFLAFCQYNNVRETENTKVITLQELPNLTSRNLGKIGDGVFFLGGSLYSIDGQLIAKDLKVSNSISGNDIPVFSKGKATFNNGETMGILDKTGKIIWSVKKGYGYSISDKFVDGYAVKVTVKQSTPYREYIDGTGKVVFPALTAKCSYGQQFNAFPYVNGLARFFNPATYKWGFVNMKGQIVIPAKYSAAHDFSEGLAAVCFSESGNWGYINEKGEKVIEDKFSREPTDFVGGTAVAEKNDGTSLGWGEKVFINTKGEVVSAGWYQKVIQLEDFKLAKKKDTPQNKGYVLDRDCKEVEFIEASDLFPTFTDTWPQVVPEAGYILTQNNLRGKNGSVLFISKSSFPVNGRDSYWFDLYNGGDGYYLLVDNYAYVHGIVNEQGEVVIRFKKSEF